MTDNPALAIVSHPLVQHKLSLMRREDTPVAVFRRLLRETALLLVYEASRDLATATVAIRTPLANTEGVHLADPTPALVSILRAGIGFLDGALEILPEAPVGFVGLYRDEATLRPVRYYCKLPPEMSGRRTLLLDPMLATGNTAVAALDLVKEHGATDIRFICLLAAPEGVARLSGAHPDVPVVTAALDERLDERGYIRPGLGDAGDRLFGTI